MWGGLSDEALMTVDKEMYANDMHTPEGILGRRGERRPSPAELWGRWAARVRRMNKDLLLFLLLLFLRLLYLLLFLLLFLLPTILLLFLFFLFFLLLNSLFSASCRGRKMKTAERPVCRVAVLCFMLLGRFRFIFFPNIHLCEHTDIWGINYPAISISVFHINGLSTL